MRDDRYSREADVGRISRVNIHSRVLNLPSVLYKDDALRESCQVVEG